MCSVNCNISRRGLVAADHMSSEVTTLTFHFSTLTRLVFVRYILIHDAYSHMLHSPGNEHQTWYWHICVSVNQFGCYIFA